MGNTQIKVATVMALGGAIELLAKYAPSRPAAALRVARAAIVTADFGDLLVAVDDAASAVLAAEMARPDGVREPVFALASSLTSLREAHFPTMNLALTVRTEALQAMRDAAPASPPAWEHRETPCPPWARGH